MAYPSDQPDAFCYDPPATVNVARGNTETTQPTSAPVNVGATSMQMNRGRSQPIPYAPPGSTSSSINPASTVAFMLNMGYPPPPIALEPLRRLLEQMTQGPGQVLNLQLALHVTDEISRSPYRISPAVLFVLQQRLHSSKPDRVTLALELLDMCVKNCGLDFVRHINKEFMKSMVSVIKTTSFKERTITGQMKKLEKYLIGSPSSTGVATDPRVHKLKRQCLTMIQNWADAFMMHPSSVQPILEAYKSLRRKGVQFPPRDTTQKYLVKHAEDSPAFEASEGATAGGVVLSATSSRQSVPSSAVLSMDDNSDLTGDPFKTEDNVEDTGDCPFNERQFAQLEKLINVLRTSEDAEIIERALDMCEQLRPKLEEALKVLTNRINSTQGRKLRGSDPRVAQLNAILDLDSEVKKRKGARLIYGGSAKTTNAPARSSTIVTPRQDSPQLVIPPIQNLSTRSLTAGPSDNLSTDPWDMKILSANPWDATPAIEEVEKPEPAKQTTVNLLDDLLD
eukprot:Blabericola_migrator_1__13131@NODE_899_length_6146_cov_140_321928_g629_i0_p1_GENE_NODE_899_length_6146_cov_140_321928_g629_i0NODE_899_length_6146_cov_140_321928_g629_i0_p1_ORF_typecomplete_len508_score85_67VHS/PF00790_19/6_5e19VHS/PF00790_19/25BURP/PF03181_15/0_15ENTH/PF01417_20/0_23ENTH/PF01417_20/6_5e03Telomere_reg2/PF10193_9/3e02Telomere_reg2/PF10193_9/3_6_NODE_899_length_6146_cov_140_321928_g629_i033324855